MADIVSSSSHPLLPPTSEDDRLGWLRLLRSHRVGVSTFYRLMAEHGTAEAALAALPDVTVEIETNGTALPPPKLDVWVDQFNISPKLAHSGNARELVIVPAVLRRYASDGRAFFKFVVAEPADVDEVREVVRANALPRGRVFVMAEGTDGATLRARQEWLVPLCLEHGFRLSDRLHIHLFGDTRGT